MNDREAATIARDLRIGAEHLQQQVAALYLAISQEEPGLAFRVRKSALFSIARERERLEKLEQFFQEFR